MSKLSEHSYCDYPGCERCRGQIPALEWHKSGACFNPPEPYGACERSVINPNKCNTAIHYESIMKCCDCNYWISKVKVYETGICYRCCSMANVAQVTSENLLYEKIKK